MAVLGNELCNELSVSEPFNEPLMSLWACSSLVVQLAGAEAISGFSAVPAFGICARSTAFKGVFVLTSSVPLSDLYFFLGRSACSSCNGLLLREPLEILASGGMDGALAGDLTALRAAKALIGSRK